MKLRTLFSLFILFFSFHIFGAESRFRCQFKVGEKGMFSLSLSPSKFREGSYSVKIFQDQKGAIRSLFAKSVPAKEYSAQNVEFVFVDGILSLEIEASEKAREWEGFVVLSEELKSPQGFTLLSKGRFKLVCQKLP